MASKRYRFLIFDLDGTLIHLNCDWDLIKSLREKGKNAMADVIEMQGVMNGVPISPMVDFVKKRKCKKALFTMNSTITAVRAINFLGLWNQFPIMVTRDDVQYYKPDVEGLQIIFDQVDCGQDEILYIGDREIDFIAGAKFGVKVISPKQIIQYESVR